MLEFSRKAPLVLAEWLCVLNAMLPAVFPLLWLKHAAYDLISLRQAALVLGQGVFAQTLLKPLSSTDSTFRAPAVLQEQRSLKAYCCSIPCLINRPVMQNLNAVYVQVNVALSPCNELHQAGRLPSTC